MYLHLFLVLVFGNCVLSHPAWDDTLEKCRSYFKEHYGKRCHEVDYETKSDECKIKCTCDGKTVFIDEENFKEIGDKMVCFAGDSYEVADEKDGIIGLSQEDGNACAVTYYDLETKEEIEDSHSYTDGKHCHDERSDSQGTCSNQVCIPEENDDDEETGHDGDDDDEADHNGDDNESGDDHENDDNEGESQRADEENAGDETGGVTKAAGAGDKGNGITKAAGPDGKKDKSVGDKKEGATDAAGADGANKSVGDKKEGATDAAGADGAKKSVGDKKEGATDAAGAGDGDKGVGATDAAGTKGAQVGADDKRGAVTDVGAADAAKGSGKACTCEKTSTVSKGMNPDASYKVDAVPDTAGAGNNPSSAI